MFLRNTIKTVWGKSQKDSFYGFLVNIIGAKPKNIEIYLLAFRHKSDSIYANGEKLNNERLEFLGDAILGAIVSDILFEKYPKQKEGFLTKLRSNIVSRKSLNAIGRQLNLEKYLLINGTLTDNTFGNCVEALIGAIYLDLGFKKTKVIVKKQFLEKYVDFEDLLKIDENYKSKLVEAVQHDKKSLEFKTAELIKNHHPYFHARVFIDEILFGEGRGFSKKQAEQMAAKHTLRKIKRDKRK